MKASQTTHKNCQDKFLFFYLYMYFCFYHPLFFPLYLSLSLFHYLSIVLAQNPVFNFQVQNCILSLLATNIEIALTRDKVSAVSSSPMYRLQFWRDTFKAIYQGVGPVPKLVSQVFGLWRFRCLSDCGMLTLRNLGNACINSPPHGCYIDWMIFLNLIAVLCLKARIRAKRIIH